MKFFQSIIYRGGIKKKDELYSTFFNTTMFVLPK